MFSGATFSKFNRRNLSIWCALAFQAGVLNAGGFLACHRFVTHVSAVPTQIGVFLAEGAFEPALGMFSVPLFFISGAILSALMIDRQILRKRQPHYSQVLFLLTCLSFAVVTVGHLGGFGEFGEPLVRARDYTLLGLLCFTAGLQNAMVTSASGAVVRTTHLTGITTDLGIGLVRIFSHTHLVSRRVELQAAWMRIGIIVSFLAGSLVSGFIFMHNQFWGFTLPLFISMILWLSNIAYNRKLHPAPLSTPSGVTP